jgi:hypothetical protein
MPGRKSTIFRGKMWAIISGMVLASVIFLQTAPLQARGPVGPLLNIDMSPGDLIWSGVYTTCDSVNNRFLVVASEWGADYMHFYGTILNADGSTFANRIPICTNPVGQHAASQPAFDPLRQRYLAVWADNRVGFWQCYGRFINADGSFASEDFRISPEEEWWSPGALVYDSASHRFMLVMVPEIYPYNLWVKFINGDGSISGPPRKITDFTEGYGAWNCTSAYDANHQRFLVAYGADYPVHETRAQVLNADGSSFSGEFVLSSVEHMVTSCAFDPINNRYLVLWGSAWIEDLPNHGQLVDAAGNLVGNPVIVTDGYYEGGLGVVYDSRNRKFLVTGSAYSVTPTYDGVFAQSLNPDGSRFGAPVAMGSAWQLSASTAYSRISNKTLVTWLDMTGSGKDVYGKMVSINQRSKLGGVLLLLLKYRNPNITNQGELATARLPSGAKNPIGRSGR